MDDITSTQFVAIVPQIPSPRDVVKIEDRCGTAYGTREVFRAVNGNSPEPAFSVSAVPEGREYSDRVTGLAQVSGQPEGLSLDTNIDAAAGMGEGGRNQTDAHERGRHIPAGQNTSLRNLP